MIIIKHIEAVKKILSLRYKPGGSTGFVPTMGALHKGHISLLEICKAANDFCVASIFINPTQFNNSADFEKYPVTLEKDIEMLEAAGCDLLFLPLKEEIYPAGETPVHYELGYLEDILEGTYRPGHFQGVCQVVDKLLRIVKPSTLYLGSKDYQQCMVIQKMIEVSGNKVSLQLCPTVREPDGLAMSSRNLRLDTIERKHATAIIQALKHIKNNLTKGQTDSLTTEAVDELKHQGFKVDYISIADASTLLPVSAWDGNSRLIALAAAYLNDIRLIDNIELN